MITLLRNWNIYKGSNDTRLNIGKPNLKDFKTINHIQDTISFSRSRKVTDGEYYFDPRSKLSDNYIVKKFYANKNSGEFEIIPISNLEKNLFHYKTLQNHYFRYELAEDKDKQYLLIQDRYQHIGKKVLKGLNKDIMPLVVHAAIEESCKHGYNGKIKIISKEIGVIDYLLKLGFTPEAHHPSDEKIIQNIRKNKLPQEAQFLLNISCFLEDKTKIDKAKERCIKDIDTNLTVNYTKYIKRGPLYLLPNSDSFEIGLGNKVELNKNDSQTKFFKAKVTLDKADNNSLIVENQSNVLFENEFNLCRDGEKLKLQLGDEFTIGNTLYRYTPKGFRLLSEDSYTITSLFYLKDNAFQLRQSKLGNCYLVSSLYSLSKSYEGRELIYRMIEKVDNDKYQITFPGFPKDHFIVSKKEIDPNSLSAFCLTDGPALLELAFGKLLQKYQINENRVVKDTQNPYSWLDIGGNATFALYALTGSKVFDLSCGQKLSIDQKIKEEENTYIYLKNFITSLLKEDAITDKERNELEKASEFLTYPPSMFYKYSKASINLLNELINCPNINQNNRVSLEKTLKQWQNEPYLNDEIIVKIINSIELAKNNNRLNKSLNKKINVILKFLYSVQDYDEKKINLESKLVFGIPRFNFSKDKVKIIFGRLGTLLHSLDNTHYKKMSLFELISKHPNRYIACVGNNSNHVGNLLTNHVFAIDNVDLASGKITLADPHDTSNFKFNIPVNKLFSGLSDLYVAKLPFKWDD